MERHIMLIKKLKCTLFASDLEKQQGMHLVIICFWNYTVPVSTLLSHRFWTLAFIILFLLHCWRSTCYSCDAKSQRHRLPHGPIDGIWWSFGLYLHLSFGYLCPWLNAMAQEMDSHLALSLSISSRPEKRDLGKGWVVVAIERQHPCMKLYET